MIYTQDMNDTWYYQFDSLELYNEKVKTTVTEMENSEYKDKLVYCIYNEMDNGEWFGNHWRRLTDITFSNDSIVVSVKEIGQMKNYLTITPNDMTIYNGATIEDDGNTSSGKRIGWISSENGGCATFNVSVEDAGYYNFIIEYANSEEGGFHAYNVDLIER